VTRACGAWRLLNPELDQEPKEGECETFNAKTKADLGIVAVFALGSSRIKGIINAILTA
jgi:hypothetical protein